jgi:ParB family transcriptional regulator, chromosome partitioning protein
MSTTKKNEIGKGISALLGNISNEITAFKLPDAPKAIEKTLEEKKSDLEIGSISMVALSDIQTNPKQPRKQFDEVALNELSESIKLHGIIQPITIIKNAEGAKCKYQLISGERRWRASKIAGLDTIPAYLRTADNQAQIELALLENLQREDLNAIEVALSYRLLMDECNLTQEEVAERMKKERSTVTNYIRLLKLSPTIQQSVIKGVISMGHARSLLSVEHIEQQLFMHNEIIVKQLSVRQAEALAKELNKPTSQGDNSDKPKQISLAPAYKKIQDSISSHLSTKVEMVRKTNGKGSITIEFYNDNDLTRIIDAMHI